MANRPLIIIDSETSSNQYLSGELAKHGFDVSVYTEGKPAIDAVGQVHPVLVLLCLELSDVSGYVVCKKIKENDATAATPIIIMSKDASEKDFERHRKLKVAAQDYISKPFDNAAIMRKVENLVGFNVSPEQYESLEAKLEGMFEQGTTDDEIKLKQSEIDRLTEELDAVRRELLQAKTGGAASHAAAAEVEQLRAQLAQAQASSGSQSAALQQQVTQLTSERNDLQSKLAIRDNSIKELGEFKVNAELQIQELNAQVQRLNNDLANAQQASTELAQLQQLYAASQNQLTAAQQQVAQVGERYQAENEQLREELNSIEAEAAENLQAAQQRTQQLSEQLQGLQNQLQQAVNESDRKVEKREAELLAEIESIREQIDMMREDYESRIVQTKDEAKKILESGLAALNS